MSHGQKFAGRRGSSSKHAPPRKILDFRPEIVFDVFCEGSATCSSSVRDFEIRRVYTTKISGFQERFPDFHWDFRITQALVGISDYKQNFARFQAKYCEISGFQAKIFKILIIISNSTFELQ